MLGDTNTFLENTNMLGTQDLNVVGKFKNVRKIAKTHGNIKTLGRTNNVRKQIKMLDDRWCDNTSRSAPHRIGLDTRTGAPRSDQHSKN